MKKQFWVVFVIVMIIAIYLFSAREQYSPPRCNEHHLLNNVQQNFLGSHTAKLESEERDLAVISIDNKRELFQRYSANHYNFGTVRVSFYGPQDDKLTITVCT